MQTLVANIGEPTADAPLTPWRRRSVGGLHFLAALGLVAFVVFALVKALSPRDRVAEAEVTLVAKSLTEVRAEVDGRFDAVRPRQNGERVCKGEPLGVLYVPDLLARIAAKERRLRTLQERKLLLDVESPEFGATASEAKSEREFRELTLVIEETELELQRLSELRAQNQIASPVEGFIHYGLSSSRTVKALEPVAHVFPVGGELFVEVKAPLALIHQLIGRNEVEVVIPTPQGERVIKSRPLAATLRTSTKEHAGNRDRELWGVIQCEPDSLPSAVRIPGLNGILK